MRLPLWIVLAVATPLSALAQESTTLSDSSQLPLKPPPTATGVVPLPQGPPDTSQQGPVPKPIQKLATAEHPLLWSPDLKALKVAVKDRAVTLQEAISIALYTNRSFATAVASWAEASARTGEARALLMPNLGVNGQLPYYDQATEVSLGGGTPILVNPQFNPVYTAAFTLPIDVAGTLHSAVSQAQFSEVASRIDVNRVRNQIVYDVKSAFYNVLRAQAQVVVATDSVNNALIRLSLSNKNYAAGTASRFDVITAQRDVSDAQQNLVTAKASVSVNLVALKNTIGLDTGSRLRITDKGAVLPPPDVTTPTLGPIQAKTGSADAAPPAPAEKAPQLQITPLASPSTDDVEDDFDFGPEYQSLLKEALGTRPEVMEADAQVSAAKHGVAYARRSALPSLSLGIDYVYTPNATPLERAHQDIATLNVSVPIFDGGVARARVREAQAVVAQAEIARRQATDQVQVDLQQAYIALVQARQRVAVANVEKAQAQEAFRVSQARYNSGVSQQTGVSPQLELSNAQISLTQAQTNVVNALYDYNTARAQLDRALGRYSIAPEK